jgi:hypothetical protein
MTSDRPKSTPTLSPTGGVAPPSERRQTFGEKLSGLARDLRRREFEVAVRGARFVPGVAKSFVISVASLLKSDTPRSAEMLKHYVEGSGKPYELKDISKQWQDWIVKQTSGTPGVHKDLFPYNAGIGDLRNSLGHFDVAVTRNADGSRTYEITDKYAFPPTEHDTEQKGRHGFPVTERQREQILDVGLPTGTWRNPGGFDESFEIKKVGHEYILYIPQQVLAENGTPFEVKGSFTRPVAGH